MKLSKRGLKAAGVFFAVLSGCTVISLFLSVGTMWMLRNWGVPAAMAVTLLSVFVPATIIIYFAAAEED